MRFSLIGVLYIITLIAGGLYAFKSAPEPAAARTALLIPAVCAALIAIGLLTITRRRSAPRLARIAIWATVALPLAFAGAFAARTAKAHTALAHYPAARQAYDAALPEQPQLTDPALKRAFFRDRGSPDHDTTYLRDTLAALSGASLIACAALFVSRRSLTTSPPGH